MIGAIGPPSPVYQQLYQAVREANLRRRGKHQLRIVLGDPYGDWDKIKNAEDLGPYLGHRDQCYAQVVKKKSWPGITALCSSWAQAIFCAGMAPAWSNAPSATLVRNPI